MNNFDYKNMTPFKWFVLENFPFIENDFEAINNYRLFSKVVEYLNKTIDNVNVLGNLVEQFSDYFDNLDVQEEINNKLDEMAEDGTLTSIITTYVNPLIQEQNEIISTIQNNTETAINNQNASINQLTGRVNSLATLTQGSTTGDAELIDIRTGFNGITYSNAGTAVRKQCGGNNELIKGLISGVLNNQESLTVDKLSVDSNFTQDTYNYYQEENASTSSGYITYIHKQDATSFYVKGKLIIKTPIHTLKIFSRISGNTQLFYTFTNLQAGDVLYLDKSITVPTSTESTVRLMIVAQNTTTEREFDLINPVFLQDNTVQTSGTYGFESASAGTCTKTSKTYKALATKDYVDSMVNGSSSLYNKDFGCAGDSITAEPSGTNQWPYYVCTELGLLHKHNVAVGSSTYANKVVTYNGVTYTPQNYTDSGFAGYSTASTPTSATQAQQIANNCAKCHIEQFISEVNNSTYPTPDVFIFAYGTNDNPNNAGSIEDAFSGSLDSIDKTTIAGGMRYALEKITTAFPNCQCFVLNILQSAYSGYQSRDAQLTKNNIIKEVADYFSIPVIDQYDESGITRLYEVAGSNGRYLQDGLHPNVAGRKKQAEYIVRELQNKTTNKIN